jgi:hypothetical protein
MKSRDLAVLDGLPRKRKVERTVVDGSRKRDEPTDEGPALDTDPGSGPLPPDGGDGKTLVFEENGTGSRAGAAAGPRGKLSIVGGPKAGTEWMLADDETTIGRGQDNVWVIADISVSRRHVLVKRTSAGFAIHDQRSGNGTVVNGVRLEEDRILETGDEIEMGDTVLRFEALGASRAIAMGSRGRAIAIRKGQGPRTATAVVRPTTGEVAAAIPARRRRLYAVIGAVAVLMLILGGWYRLNKPRVVLGPSQPGQEELGARAFKAGLELFKQEKYEEALEQFDLARQNLADPEEANRDFEETGKEIAARRALAAANLALAKQQLGAAMGLVSKIDSGSRLYDAAEELRKKIRDALARSIKDARAALDAGELARAEKTINEVLAVVPTDADANQVKVDLAVKNAKLDAIRAKKVEEDKAHQRSAEEAAQLKPLLESQAAFKTGNDAEALRLANGCAATPGKVGDDCGKTAQAIKAFGASYRAGMEAARERRTADAIRLLGEARKQHARVLDEEGSDRLVELKKQLGAMLYLVGNQAQGNDELAKACSSFHQAAEADPGSGLARKQAIACTDKAKELYQQAYVDKGLDKEKAIRELHLARALLSKADPFQANVSRRLSALESGSGGD